ncbi:hypothetical protein [Larsenimonas suaedae]|uniref:Uncharacterized protein n=1 Tax=Larsenimonas suaedae TaxID=1851019 RepID=A0ABU1GUX5_9GAMM|nr:hypothetical protein [Larsenimonas suaedae]MCM2971117.1 hypothetical protein [Larsenimonas suaedae]MDR5895826.1 hypothetical protein [Larsenimonas suaedae]
MQTAFNIMLALHIDPKHQLNLTLARLLADSIDKASKAVKRNSAAQDFTLSSKPIGLDGIWQSSG